jgi:hypothetical protein
VLARGETMADRPIDATCDEDTSASAYGQKRQSRFAAGIISFREVEEPGYRGAELRLQGGRRLDEVGRREIPDEASRQIAATHPSVVRDVAAEVGELHGDTEIDGVRRRGGFTRVEDAAHHEADGARRPVAISQELGFIRHAHGLGVGRHARDELARDRRVDPAFAHER